MTDTNYKSYRHESSRVVDFDLLEKGKSDPTTAMWLRHKFGLDTSKDGSVFCDEAECRERLAAGLLPPVLTPAQFAKLSRGVPYGDSDSDVTGVLAEVTQAGGETHPRTNPFATHPHFSEYQALPHLVKAELGGDFRSFLFLKQRGKLGAVIDSIYEHLAREASETARRDVELAHQHTLKVAAETPEYRALAARYKGNKNYPGLQDQRDPEPSNKNYYGRTGRR